MKEHPILFNQEMVKAEHADRKTQTRRAVKPQPINEHGEIYKTGIIGPEFYEPATYDKNGDMISGKEIFGAYDEYGDWGVKCPYGKIGDRLWVRETFRFYDGEDDTEYTCRSIEYRADTIGYHPDIRWKPSIYMPRRACRTVLEIVDIRIERVQDITEADAMAEGIKEVGNCSPPDYDYNAKQYYVAKSLHETAKNAFQHLWNSINAKRGMGWDVNPWVWVVEFKRCENI